MELIHKNMLIKSFAFCAVDGEKRLSYDNHIQMEMSLIHWICGIPLVGNAGEQHGAVAKCRRLSCP